MKNNKKLFSSRVSIIGLFFMLTMILTVPLVLLMSQQREDIRQRAAGPSPDLLPPVKGFGYISGYVYQDINQDGERNNAENGVANVQIKLTQINANSNSQNPDNAPDLVTMLTTDSNGYFKYKFSNLIPDSVTFMLKVILPPGYKTIDTNPLIISDLHRDATDVVEFGIYSVTPLSPVPSLSPTPTSLVKCTNRSICDPNYPTKCHLELICPSPPPALSTQPPFKTLKGD